MIAGKITSEDLARTRLGETSLDVKINNAKRDNPASNQIESKVDETDVRSEESCARIAKISKDTEDEMKEAERESDKEERDVRIPETILGKSAECERTKQFPERIPIGAPAAMNKIFDSRQVETIADVRGNVETAKKHVGIVSCREAHIGGRSDEETNVEIEDPRRIASRSALSLNAKAATSRCDDKCAIARRTTCVIPCNNNDNKKAVTAVANVSNDQSSRDVATITPGKVRSFVKYYEIRGDTTTVEGHSKINDGDKVAKRKSTKKHRAPCFATRGLQWPKVATERGNDGSNDAPDTSLMQLCSKMSRNFIENSVREKSQAGSRLAEERESIGAHVVDETHVLLAKTSMKKSVQFRRGFIRSQTFDEQSAEIVVDHDANASKKNTIPCWIPSSRHFERHVREMANFGKLPGARKDFLLQRETQIDAVNNHGERSGINRFVTKSKTPQIVFYCTV